MKTVIKWHRSWLLPVLVVLLTINQTTTLFAPAVTVEKPKRLVSKTSYQKVTVEEPAEPSNEALVAQIESETDVALEAPEDELPQKGIVQQAEGVAEEASLPQSAAVAEEPVVEVPVSSQGEEVVAEGTEEPASEEALTEEEVIEESALEEPDTNNQLLKLLSASKKLNIPVLGTFIFDTVAAIAPDAMGPTAEVTGKPEKTVLDLKVVQLSNQVMSFSLFSGFQLDTAVACFGQELGQTLISITFDHKAKFTGFWGSLDADKVLKPFEKISAAKNIPGLKDIAIRNMQLGFDAAKNLSFTGESTILGCSTQTQITIAESSPVLKATLLEPFNLTKILPVLKGTPLASLSFADAYFIVSSEDYYDPETRLTSAAGISIAGTMKLSGPIFENVRKLIPILPTEAFTLCSIGEEPLLILHVSDGFNLDRTTSLERIFLQLKLHKLGPTGPHFELSLKTRIKTKLPKEQNYTFFTGAVSIPLDPGIPTVIIKGTMEGTWNNVLGLKGISISDVAFELGASIATGFTPTSVGFAGTLAVGDKKVRMATKTSKEGEFVLYGKLDGEIGFTDILSLASATGLKVPEDKIPDFSLKNVEVKIAPKAATIGEFFFPKGTTLIGELTIKGCDFLKTEAGKIKAILDVTIESMSINGKGSMSAISLANILKITGPGPDAKKGTPDDGPTVKLVLSPFEQSFILSGEIVILGVRCFADVNLSPMDAYFNTVLDIIPGLSLKARGEMVKTGTLPDFKITGELTAPSMLPFGKQDLEAGTQILEENRDNVKADFQKKLGEIEDKIRARQKIMEANPAYKKLVSELEGARSKVRSVEQEVGGLESKLRGLDSEISALERKLGVAFNLDRPNIDIEVPLFKDTLQLSFNNRLTELLLTEQLDPAKIDLRFYDQRYPLLCFWGWCKQTFVEPVQRHVVEPVRQKVVEPVIKAVTTVVQKTGVEGLAEKVGGKDAIEKLKKAGYNVVKIAANPANWDDAIKLAGLKTAREAARLALEAAKLPLKGLQLSLRGLEESVKNFDPEILKWRAEQAALSAKMGTEIVALEAAILTFKTTTLAAFPALNWLTPIEIKKLTVTVNLGVTGKLPSVSCDVKAFHAIDKTITFSADLSSIPNILKRLVLKAFLLKS